MSEKYSGWFHYKSCKKVISLKLDRITVPTLLWGDSVYLSIIFGFRSLFLLGYKSLKRKVIITSRGLINMKNSLSWHAKTRAPHPMLCITQTYCTVREHVNSNLIEHEFRTEKKKPKNGFFKVFRVFLCKSWCGCKLPGHPSILMNQVFPRQFWISRTVQHNKWKAQKANGFIINFSFLC